MYIYDDNGNLVATLPPGGDGATRYGYDQRNLLITSTLDSGAGYEPLADFAYDGMGHRLQQVDYRGSQTVTITYTNDILGLSQVLVADDDATQVSNLFGLDLISQDKGIVMRYLLADGLGSVRVEMVGSVLETVTTYEPYGNLLAQSGNSGTGYGFTGEQEDTATGLLYLRARYYSHNLRTFMMRDGFSGFERQPVSQHPYAYVANNPINYSDPTGLCAEFGDDGCWSIYDQVVALCPTCAGWRDPWSGRSLAELNIYRLEGFLADIRAGWRPNDPLTKEQWNLAKQEATRFGLPKELVAATIAAEIVYDTDWVNTVYDVSTGAVGALADLAYIMRERPLFDACYALLEGFHEYFGLANELEPRGLGYGMAPGIAHIHAGPAVRTENYINQTYPGQNLLPDLGSTNQEGVRLRTLLSDEGSIRYAAAYLRWWADIRKETTSDHMTDLTETDMTIIYTVYRCDVRACYGSIKGYRDAETPSPYGHPEDFAEFLPLYRNKP